MNDMAAAIVPKSNQTNADDFITGPKTVTISKVEVRPGQEQPVSIYYEGDNGKPYKPCKSMCRVIVQAWGSDSANYAGKSMTLYRDPSVTWGGVEVGGIRISHMSHIDRDLAMALSVSKSKRQMVMIERLQQPASADPKADALWQNYHAAMESQIAETKTVDGLNALWKASGPERLKLKSYSAEMHAAVVSLFQVRRGEIEPEAGGAQ